jgi:hypothetical protein
MGRNVPDVNKRSVFSASTCSQFVAFGPMWDFLYVIVDPSGFRFSGPEGKTGGKHGLGIGVSVGVGPHCWSLMYSRGVRTVQRRVRGHLFWVGVCGGPTIPRVCFVVVVVPPKMLCIVPLRRGLFSQVPEGFVYGPASSPFVSRGISTLPAPFVLFRHSSRERNKRGWMLARSVNCDESEISED